MKAVVKSWRQTKGLIAEDLYRYTGSLGWGSFIKAWHYEAGFRFTCFLRLAAWWRAHPLTRFGPYYIASLFHRRAGIRYGVHIGVGTEIGGGFYLPHALNIVVNHACVIGRNCNLSQGVTLGVSNRGDRKGTPVIGDNVYIGPGAVVFGSIRIGDRVAIGANAVVNKDVPDDAVVGGVPARILSYEGSKGYVNQVLGEKA